VSVSSAVSTAQSAKKQRALDPPPFRAALCVRSKNYYNFFLDKYQ
jgi:hypothetical protein